MASLMADAMGDGPSQGDQTDGYAEHLTAQHCRVSPAHDGENWKGRWEVPGILVPLTSGSAMAQE